MECMSFNQLFMIPQSLLAITASTTDHHQIDTTATANAATATACGQPGAEWEPAINLLLALGMIVMILVSVLSAYMEAMLYLKSQQASSSSSSLTSTANGKSINGRNNNHGHQQNNHHQQNGNNNYQNQLIGASSSNNAKDHDRGNHCGLTNNHQSQSFACNNHERGVGGGGGGGGSPNNGSFAIGTNVNAAISTPSSHHQQNSNSQRFNPSLSSSNGKVQGNNLPMITNNKNNKFNTSNNAQKNSKRKNSNSAMNGGGAANASSNSANNGAANSNTNEKSSATNCKPIGSTTSDKKSSNIYSPMFQNLTNVIASPPPPLPAFDSEEFDTTSQSGRGDEFKKFKGKKAAKKSKKSKKESQTSESNSITETDNSAHLKQLTVMLNHQPTNTTTTTVCSSSSSSSKASSLSAASLVSSTKSSAPSSSSTSSTASSPASSIAPSSTSSSPPLSASSYGEYSLLGPGVTFELPCLRVRSAQI